MWLLLFSFYIWKFWGNLIRKIIRNAWLPAGKWSFRGNEMKIYKKTSGRGNGLMAKILESLLFLLLW